MQYNEKPKQEWLPIDLNVASPQVRQAYANWQKALEELKSTVDMSMRQAGLLRPGQQVRLNMSYGLQVNIYEAKAPAKGPGHKKPGIRI